VVVVALVTVMDDDDGGGLISLIWSPSFGTVICGGDSRSRFGVTVVRPERKKRLNEDVDH